MPTPLTHTRIGYELATRALIGFVIIKVADYIQALSRALHVGMTP